MAKAVGDMVSADPGDVDHDHIMICFIFPQV